MVRRNCCFRGCKKSHRQGILRKGMFVWPIHFVAFDVCWWKWESDSILSGSHTGEYVNPASENVKKRESVWRRSIYRKYVSWNRLQRRGTKFKWGRSFKQWSRGSPGQWFPETDCLCASAIFVSGTGGIPPILNYTSVSPIDYLYFYPVVSLPIFFQTRTKVEFICKKTNFGNEFVAWSIRTVVFLLIFVFTLS